MVRSPHSVVAVLVIASACAAGGSTPAIEDPERMDKLVSGETAEAHRISGTQAIVPDPDDRTAIADKRTVATFNVCMDPAGAVNRIVMVKSTGFPSFDDKLQARTWKWRFRPFEIDGVASEVCTAFTYLYKDGRAFGHEDPRLRAARAAEAEGRWNDVLSLVDAVVADDPDDLAAHELEARALRSKGAATSRQPPSPRRGPGTAAGGAGARIVPRQVLEGQRVAGEKAIVPDRPDKVTLARTGDARVVTTLKMCLDVSGKVSGVTFLKRSGLPDYDAKLQATILNTWRYRPFVVDGKAVPVCTSVTFIYRQLGATPTRP